MLSLLVSYAFSSAVMLLQGVCSQVGCRQTNAAAAAGSMIGRLDSGIAFFGAGTVHKIGK